MIAVEILEFDKLNNEIRKETASTLLSNLYMAVVDNPKRISAVFNVKTIAEEITSCKYKFSLSSKKKFQGTETYYFTYEKITNDSTGTT